MELDDQLQRYFGTRDIDAVAPEAVEAGLERMAVDLGMEEDRGRRFALWSLMLMLGEGPAIDSTFEEAADREAAHKFAALITNSEDQKS